MARGSEAKLFGNEPSQGVAAGLTFCRFRNGPHEVARRALYKFVRENGGLEPRHIVRGRDQAAARNLVAGVQDARIAGHSGFVFVIPAGPVGDHRKKIIRLGVLHSRRFENILPHKVHVLLRGGAFQHAPKKRVAVGRIVEFRSGFRDQWVGRENLQRLLHVRKMPGTVFGNVSLSVAVVMTDASQMAEQFTRGDRPFFLRERRAVLLNGRIEIQFAALPEL